jgi:hypothetical protein
MGDVPLMHDLPPWSLQSSTVSEGERLLQPNLYRALQVDRKTFDQNGEVGTWVKGLSSSDATVKSIFQGTVAAFPGIGPGGAKSVKYTYPSDVDVPGWNDTRIETAVVANKSKDTWVDNLYEGSDPTPAVSGMIYHPVVKVAPPQTVIDNDVPYPTDLQQITSRHPNPTYSWEWARSHLQSPQAQSTATDYCAPATLDQRQDPAKKLPVSGEDTCVCRSQKLYCDIANPGWRSTSGTCTTPQQAAFVAACQRSDGPVTLGSATYDDSQRYYLTWDGVNSQSLQCSQGTPAHDTPADPPVYAPEAQGNAALAQMTVTNTVCSGSRGTCYQYANGDCRPSDSENCPFTCLNACCNQYPNSTACQPPGGPPADSGDLVAVLMLVLLACSVFGGVLLFLYLRNK